MNKTPIKFIFAHPFLFALYPILALYVNNFYQVYFQDIARSLILSLAAVTIIFLCCGWVIKDWHRAGLISSFLLLLFFSLGHVIALFSSPGVIPIPANVLAAVWAAVAIWGSWAILRLMKRFPLAGTRLLNYVSAFALIICCINLLLKVNPQTLFRTDLQKRGQPPAPIDETLPGPAARAESDSSLPDIYYLILDGYGRSDILSEVYGVDNRDFIRFLQSHGFYVAEQSQTNYPQTDLSLASSLNYQYLDGLVAVDRWSQDRSPLVERIYDGAVMRLLRQNGYRTVAFEAPMHSDEALDVDILYQRTYRFNYFEWILLRGSAAVFWTNQLMYEAIRQELTDTFAEVRQSIHLSGPKFVFAHVIVPHPPFVFDQNGDPVSIGSNSDANYFIGTREEYLNGYRGQVAYVTRVYEQIIDEILQSSATPPIIILQSDHGPGAYLNWDSMEDTCLGERMSILNAYYLPGQENQMLYPSISPVNSFRVVLNAYFDQNLPLLPDRHYFAPWEAPYQWVDVTGKTDEQCPAWTGEVIR